MSNYNPYRRDTADWIQWELGYSHRKGCKAAWHDGSFAYRLGYEHADNEMRDNNVHARTD